MFGVLLEEARKMARDPRRLAEALRPRRWRQLLSVLRFRGRMGNQWRSTGAPGMERREYPSYDDYVRHQQSKFGYLDLSEYDRTYRALLVERLRVGGVARARVNALCLGARQGTEVKAFHDLGCFAVGIDLNPGAGNPYVLRGDFHAVQFPEQSADIVFTNSFDHAFDPEKMLGEIRRLLKPDGVLIVEAIRGAAENSPPDHYASIWWRSIDDLVGFIERHGFQARRRAAFDKPWPGEHIDFSRAESG